MTDEQFQKEAQDLIENLKNLRLIRDKGRRKWLKVIVKEQLRILIKD